MLSDQEKRDIMIATLVSASLSTLGSTFIIVMYFHRGEKAAARRKLFPVRIILYLSLFDLPTSLVTVAGAVHMLNGRAWGATPWCLAQGALV